MKTSIKPANDYFAALSSLIFRKLEHGSRLIQVEQGGLSCS